VHINTVSKRIWQK